MAAETTAPQAGSETSWKTYSDKSAEFSVPKSATVKQAIDDGQLGYVVHFDKADFFYFRIRGPQERPEHSKLRTEKARSGMLKLKGKTVKDGDSETRVKKVSEVRETETATGKAYLFSSVAIGRDSDGGGVAFTTIGFGRFLDRSVWFQHTGLSEGTQPDHILKLLKSLRLKKG